MRDVIETNRLTLRRMTAQDCGRVVEFLGDWDVASMLSRIAHPYAPDHYLAWQATHAETWAKQTNLPFAITTARDGLIGCIGIDGERDVAGRYEIGYWLGKPYWGQGYATEAGAALLAQAEHDLGIADFISRHFVENEKSGQVLQKLGFSYTGDVKPSPCLARGHDVAARMMERPQPNRPTREERP